MKTELENMLEVAWGIIANAGGGDWSKETEVWQAAAIKWRDKYHALNKTLRAMDAADDSCRVEDGEYDSLRREQLEDQYQAKCRRQDRLDESGATARMR